MSIPILKTKRLMLRDIALADIPSYERHFIDYEVVRTLADSVPWPYPAGGIRNFIETTILPHQGNNFWAWGLCLNENPHEIIGGLTLRADHPNGNRGFWLGRKFWGQGLMSEAVEVTLEFAFTQAGFEILHFQNAQGNTASRRIKQSTGAKFIGLKPSQYVDPLLTQSECWSLSKKDWLARITSPK